MTELDQPARAPAKPERPVKLVADEEADGRRMRTQTVYVSPKDPNWRGSNSVSILPCRYNEQAQCWFGF
jgi:hypothetical protein